MTSNLESPVFPAHPNGSSALASAMSWMTNSRPPGVSHGRPEPCLGRTVVAQPRVVGPEPTAPNMVNAHFRAQAPLYMLAIDQFKSSFCRRFNAVVDAVRIATGHVWPIERIESELGPL